MTEEKKNIAQTVEKNTENQSSSETVSSEQLQEAVGEKPVISLDDIDPKKIAMAEEMGIPIGKLVNWVNQTDAKLNFVVKTLPQAVRMGIQEYVAEVQKQQKATYDKAVAEGNLPQGGGGGGLGQIIQAINRFGGGGGGESSWWDEEMKGLVKDTFKTNILRSKRETNILENVGIAVISKITGKTVGDVVKELAG